VPRKLALLLAAGCGATPVARSTEAPEARPAESASPAALARRVAEWRAPRKPGLHEPDWDAQPPEWPALVAAVTAHPLAPPPAAVAAFLKLGADTDRADLPAAVADCRALLGAAVWSAPASLECAMIDAAIAHYPRARWLMGHVLELVPTGPIHAFARAKLDAWDGLPDGSSFYGEKEPCDLAGTACRY
jgi:hypothetical protein